MTDDGYTATIRLWANVVEHGPSVGIPMLEITDAELDEWEARVNEEDADEQVFDVEVRRLIFEVRYLRRLLHEAKR